MLSTRTAGSTSREAGGVAPSARSRGSAARSSPVIAEMSARRAWTAAVNLRKAIHLRIVAAYRSQLVGFGSGPSDVDLRLFARIAVAEERLRRVLDRAKVHPSCNREASSVRLATHVRRGEIQ